MDFRPQTFRSLQLYLNNLSTSKWGSFTASMSNEESLKGRFEAPTTGCETTRKSKKRPKIYCERLNCIKISSKFALGITNLPSKAIMSVFAGPRNCPARCPVNLPEGAIRRVRETQLVSRHQGPTSPTKNDINFQKKNYNYGGWITKIM
jgi:hypothetical protein